jgi:hypothetical protein
VSQSQKRDRAPFGTVPMLRRGRSRVGDGGGPVRAGQGVATARLLGMFTMPYSQQAHAPTPHRHRATISAGCPSTSSKTRFPAATGVRTSRATESPESRLATAGAPRWPARDDRAAPAVRIIPSTRRLLPLLTGENANQHTSNRDNGPCGEGPLSKWSPPPGGRPGGAVDGFIRGRHHRPRTTR